MKLRPFVLGCVFLLGFANATIAQTANIGVNFQSMSAHQIGDAFNGFGTPPDTNGAVGPNNFFQYNNGGLAIFDKAGNVTTSLFRESTFWLNAGLTSTIAQQANGDPRVIYDQLSGRWVATAFTGANNNRILVARSDTSDPNGTWKAVSFQAASGQFADFPTLGIDKNGITIAVNNFSSTTSNFTGVFVYSLPKADLYASTPAINNMTTFANTTTGFSTQAVNNFNPNQTASSPTQLVAVNTGSSSSIRLTPINGVGAAGATLGGLSTPSVVSYSAPPDAPIVNATGTGLTGNMISTNEASQSSAVYRVGDLIYMAHSTSASSNAAIRITVLNASTAVPTVLAETTISSSTFDMYYPSIAANANGDIVVGYTRSGFVSSGSPDNLYPSSFASIGKLTGSTLTFGTPIQLRAGQATYTGFDGSPYRWGDYSATSPDPADTGIFWTTQEFATNDSGNTNYGTQASEIIPNVTGEVRWKAAGAGAFTDTTKWFNGAVPGASDHVIFSRWSPTSYTVNLTGGATNDRLSIRQTGTGTLTLNIPTGATWTLSNTSANTPSFVVSEFQGQSHVVITGGGTLSTNYALIAPAAIGVATVTVDGAGTLWTNANDLSIGGTATTVGGEGRLNITNGASVVVGGTLGLYQGNGTAIQVQVGVASNLSVAGLVAGSGVTPRIDLANANSTLTITDGLNTTYAGVVTGAGQVSKQGTGTITLTGANTYTGATTITGGTLALSGTGSIAASQTVTVGSGATLSVSGVTGGANFDAATNQFTLAAGQTLQGTGTVNSGVTVRPGATIRGDVGTGTGTLNVAGDGILQGATGTSGATLTAAISGNGTSTPVASTIAATNLNLVADSTNKLNINIVPGTSSLPQFQEYTAVLATVTGTIQLNGVALAPNTVIDASFYNLTTTAFPGFDASYLLAVDSTGQSLVLTFTPVPEPTTALAVATAGLSLWRLRRKRLAHFFTV